MKILTTQLSGLLQRIAQSEEEAIEETARLLAQASVGEGKVYLACFDELEGVELNALNGSEPFHKLAKWTPETVISDVDRVCIFTKSCENEAALAFAKKLSEEFIPFAAVASEKADENNPLSELAYTYISMKIRGGILPHPTKLGERTLIPHLLGALFVYEAIKLNYDEIIFDDDEL
ncbi:DUF2529 family protein [Ureibacillus manganicus]|uniref:DUF2529 domain-containing protein n=1 Tax=Ureibacillus manganicus DSM 26584 TaxID=1384049 RepID=A0A0A3IBI6_9BACL|nr:DUF2529 family protein [Ureibacillus manganicus]KGR80183.1 hypothetical protein CD29_02155 [Ureibacillus manganicus DSM 26584]